MSAAPAVISPQSGADITACWRDVPLVGGSSCISGSPPPRLMSGDGSSSGDEYNAKVRKPYTITKQRERWTEAEHAKFLEALKLYGRAWRRIEEHIGTKTAVQIRSHAQKFFSKLEKEASQGSSSGKVQDIEIPPPRPKRKPSHPYPRKVGTSPLAGVQPELPSVDDLPTPATPCNSKSAAFVPYGKGGSAACSKSLHGNLLGQENLIEAQAGLKLFGKTVVLPTTRKGAAQKEMRKDPYRETSPKEKLPSPTVQTLSIQKEGFSPYVKAVTNVQICQEGGSLEGSDESNVEIPTSTDASLLTDCESKKVPSQGNEETTPYTSQVKSGKVTHESPAIVNSRFSSAYAGSQSNPAYLWMDSFFHYYGRPPVLPQSACGSTDGLQNTAVTPWHLLQASAINQSAAYVAALAAARWAELVTGSQAGIGIGAQAPGGIITANYSEGQKMPPFPDEFNNPTLTAAAASWWALKGVVPPPFVHIPPSARLSSEDDQLCLTPTASPPGPKNADETSILHEIGDHIEDHISDAPTNDEDICAMMTQNLQHEDGRPASDGDPKSISCIRAIDTTILEDEKSMQRSCSSGDEFEQDEKKSAEGSSTGSNTPTFRGQSSEPETTNTSGSDVKEDVLSKKQGINNYECGQEILGSSSACPKMKFKNMEKGKRHQHKDIRYGENESGKRLKSCVHDVESRKEVSQEGRKAFEALFVSKTLPQTFSPVTSTTGVKNHPNEKHTAPPLMPPNSSTSPESGTEDTEGGEESHPTVKSRNDKLEERKRQEACTIVNSSSTNIVVKPGSAASCQDSRGKAHASGAADDRLPLISKDANASAFTISGRSGGSGFVPYRRPSLPVATEATTGS